MKAGIVTFQRVNNYGTVLQAYALQHAVNGLGVDCDIIDYHRNNVKDVIIWQKNKYASLLKGKPDKQLYTNWEFFKIMVLEVFLNQLASKKFDNFRKKMKFSRPVTKDTIKELNGEYDLFISGSDQVWNCGRVNLDATYMLDFVKDENKKVSYAASFGFKKIPEKYINKYREVLKDYRMVSVREQDGIEIYKKLTGKTAKLVIDPTMLLTKEDWLKIAAPRQQQKPYILVYQLGTSATLLKFAKKLAKAQNCELLVLPHAVRGGLRTKWCLGKGPEEWLSLFIHAKYVITNSFHGTAFSINLNKEFFVEVSEKRSRVAIQSRVYNLLKLVHLENRIISDSVQVKEKINYKEVNQKLNAQRESSFTYLKALLKISCQEEVS